MLITAEHNTRPDILDDEAYEFVRNSVYIEAFQRLAMHIINEELPKEFKVSVVETHAEMPGIEKRIIVELQITP